MPSQMFSLRLRSARCRCRGCRITSGDWTVFICITTCSVVLSWLPAASGCWPLFDAAESANGPGRDLESAAKAPIVVVGYVEKSLRKPFAPQGRPTYSIDFRIARIIKGHDLVFGLPESLEGPRRVYRISNFGGFFFCFSDVHENQTYILYLQVVTNRLSAFYTRVVDAAEPWSQELEDRLILQTQGYWPWSEWSPCSASCDEGTVRRTRVCARSDSEPPCSDGNVEKKHCNAFACARVRNLIDIGGLRGKTKGVIKYVEDGRQYYDITPNFYGQFSAAQLFEPTWPANYSLLLRVRPRRTRYPRQRQYLFSVTDSTGLQYLGLRLYPSPTLEILQRNGQVEEMPVGGKLSRNGHYLTDINDGNWHQFAFSVRGSTVATYYKCFKRSEHALTDDPQAINSRSANVILGTRLFKMERGSSERYEGTIDQLLITDDAGDASRQCSTRYWTEHAQLKAKNLPRQNDSPCPGTEDGNDGCLDSGGSEVVLPANGAGHWTWSAWSSCSSSCGAGEKTRTPLCLRDEQVSPDDCIPYYVPHVHIKECYERECLECNCENKGMCSEDGECKCEVGWTGRRCQEPICSGGCGLNGVCVLPEICECARGWSGVKCDTHTCFPECRNGGTCIGPNNCLCAPGYLGRSCLVKAVLLPYCQLPCLNGGQCIQGDRCHCPEGYSGEQCERDSCGGCRNGGACNTASGACTCQTMHVGRLCEYAIQTGKCQGSQACLNGGVCVDYNACYCPPDYQGQRCEFKKCEKYRLLKVSSEKPVQKRKYRYYPCPEFVGVICRLFIGYETETRNVTSYQVDLTQCDH